MKTFEEIVNLYEGEGQKVVETKRKDVVLSYLNSKSVSSAWAGQEFEEGWIHLAHLSPLSKGSDSIILICKKSLWDGAKKTLDETKGEG